MMEKYYTPKIEEFHVGFEFEFFDDDDKDWTKTIVRDQSELCNWTAYDDDWKRVKYLDKEDIESIGFKSTYTNHFISEFELNDLRISMHNGVDNLFRINMLVNSPYENHGNHYVLFCGFIKNKSELVKIVGSLANMKYTFNTI